MNERNKKCKNELNIEEIIKAYSNYLWTVVENICGNYLSCEDKEEIILDTFLALWKNKSKFDIEKEIKPYIASIAHNLTKKKLSSINSKINVVEIEDNMNLQFEDTENFIINKIKSDELNEIINQLSNEEYQIFTEFYYNSRQTKEIAKILKISNSKVKVQLHRIRNKIKKQLKERGYNI